MKCGHREALSALFDRYLRLVLCGSGSVADNRSSDQDKLLLPVRKPNSRLRLELRYRTNCGARADFFDDGLPCRVASPATESIRHLSMVLGEMWKGLGIEKRRWCAVHVGAASVNQLIVRSLLFDLGKNKSRKARPFPNSEQKVSRKSSTLPPRFRDLHIEKTRNSPSQEIRVKIN